MKDNNLIASVALFSELYNSESYRSIQDVIAEFIRGAAIYESTYSFSSTQLKDLLKKVYGFDIPESVLRTTLRSKMKTEIQRTDNIFYYNKDTASGSTDVRSEYEEINDRQIAIFNNLIGFIEKRNGSRLLEDERSEAIENFAHFLMDNGYADKYSNLISAFVLTNESDREFKKELNAIKEGVILYQGINYTADLNQLGTWSTDLTVYLGTEHLFNALGYNGILFQEIFDDFYRLVTEVNLSAKLKNSNQKRKKIELRYLEETKEEIDNFFRTAELIKKGERHLDPTKKAMQAILEGCHKPSDISARRIQFDRGLELKGIKLQEFNLPPQRAQQFNVEDQQVLEELRLNSKMHNRSFDENECLKYFRIFTKINVFRGGVSNSNFEKIGHIFITETAFAKYLAHHNAVKFAEYDIPFAKDIDFITTRLWFALKKGFSQTDGLPKSFDVITKAKIILSAHVSSSISAEYERLILERKQGTLSDDEAQARAYAMRSKPYTPEDITIENLDSSLDFIFNEDYWEDFHRETSRKDQLLQEKDQENKELKNKINEMIRFNEEVRAQEQKAEAERELSIQIQVVWNQKFRSYCTDLVYAASCYLPEVLSITLGGFIKTNKTTNTWLESLAWPAQLGFWLLLGLLFGAGIYGRSHLFNKTRINNGWRFLKFVFQYRSNKKIELDSIQDQLSRVEQEVEST